ncbi:adenylyl-sulfate kinase [Sphingobacterium tabacisoli]|nr:adenylyl-sulfate kinase [Sphingobacterium tabacisoli]
MSRRKGIIIQMTGMSGAGKTTLAFGLQEVLARQGYKAYVMDADEYRKTLCKELGFSREDRLTNIKRLAARAYELSEIYDLVIIAAINPFEEGRESLRYMYNSPLLYVKCELEQLIARDPKGLYQKALLPEGHPDRICNFTGISDPFEQPTTAKWTIDTGADGVNEAVEQVTVWLKTFIEQHQADIFYHSFLESLFLNAKNGLKKRNDQYIAQEQVFRALFEIPIFDLLFFLLNECKDVAHLAQWIKKSDCTTSIDEKVMEFYRLLHDLNLDEDYQRQLLTDEQWQHWQEKGYIQLSGLVEEEECDSVKQQICEYLEVDLNRPESWWPTNGSKIQSIMLPSLTTPASKKIKTNTKVRRVFEDLYQQKSIVSQTLPLGYNPPETISNKFRGTDLHWDIDFDRGVRYYIQGVLYLDDVETEGGAFSLVPGYQNKVEELLKEHGSPEKSMEWLKEQGLAIKLHGKKGDLILWLESLPHAATANTSSKPRFVQYVAYHKIEI